jgi:predicted MFS family arabinose efflux permease
MADQQTSSNTDSAGSRPLLRDPNLHIVFGVTLMAVIGVSSITPVLPTVAEAFSVTPQQASLLITVFTLPGVILTPFLGILGDRLGRKRILIPSLFLFALAGASLTLARDFSTLLILRTLQGIGVTALGSLNATLVGDLYDHHMRTRAMGYVSSVLSIGTASFPVIGGALAVFGWYFPFYLPLLAIPVAFAVMFRLRNPEPEGGQKLGQYFRSAAKTLSQKQLIALFAANLLTFVVLFGAYLAYFPFLLRERFGLETAGIGGMMSLMSAVTAITAANLGRITKKVAEHQLIALSGVLYALALIGMMLAPNLYLLVLPTMLFGFSQGINFPSILTLISQLAPLQQRAVVMSISGTVLRVAQTVGPIVMGLALAAGGMNAPFIAGASVALILTLLARRFIR